MRLLITLWWQLGHRLKVVIVIQYWDLIESAGCGVVQPCPAEDAPLPLFVNLPVGSARFQTICETKLVDQG